MIKYKLPLQNVIKSSNIYFAEKEGNKMKVIVVGCGKIGTAIISSLVAEGHDVTAVDLSAEVINDITNIYDAMGVCGNCVDCEVLSEAGIMKCDIFTVRLSIQQGRTVSKTPFHIFLNRGELHLRKTAAARPHYRRRIYDIIRSRNPI